MHGLGLYIYAGEDLPQADGQSESPKPTRLDAPRPVPKVVRQDNDSGEPDLLTPNQLRHINRLIMETGTDENNLLGFFGYDELAHIPKAEVNRVIRMLESNRDKEAA